MIFNFAQIVVLGCPAEEVGSYKVLMLDRGAFKDVDLVMMVHPHATSDGKVTPTEKSAVLGANDKQLKSTSTSIQQAATRLDST